MLRVTIDAAVLSGQSRFSGLGHFTRGLLGGLARRSDVQVTALATAQAELPDGVIRHPVRRLGRSRLEELDNAVRFAVDARRAGGDVFHRPAGLPGFCPPRPWVHTLHDLIPLMDPTQPPAARRQWQRFGPRLHAADAVVADSGFTADSAVRLLGLDPERITVVPCGVDPTYRPDPGVPAPEVPYLLAVGEISPRKGLDHAIAAIDALADLGYPHHLRVVGRVPDHARPGLDRLLRAARHPDRVDVVGYVDDLTTEYLQATLLLVVSRAEGFGLPAAEAMACGTPVIGFANTSLVEVVGGGGVLVPDGDVDALVGHARRLLDDAAARAEARQLALERGRAFDWSVAAEAYAQIYADVARRVAAG